MRNQVEQRMNEMLLDLFEKKQHEFTHEAIKAWDRKVGYCPDYKSFITSYVIDCWYELYLKN